MTSARCSPYRSGGRARSSTPTASTPAPPSPVVADMTDRSSRAGSTSRGGQLRKGMAVSRSWWRARGHQVRGHPRAHRPQEPGQGGTTEFEIEAPSAAARCCGRAGYSANANIVLDRREASWPSTRAAHFREGAPLRRGGGRAHPVRAPQRVRLGLSDGVKVEIVSGWTRTPSCANPPAGRGPTGRSERPRPARTSGCPGRQERKTASPLEASARRPGLFERCSPPHRRPALGLAAMPCPGRVTLLMAPTGAARPWRRSCTPSTPDVWDPLRPRRKIDAGWCVRVAAQGAGGDVERNLRAPIAGSPTWPTKRAAQTDPGGGGGGPGIRRSGSGPVSGARPPTILITTPESL